MRKAAAPEYAATPRKALESWVSAVRAGDVEMMCRLLGLRSDCAAADKKAFMFGFPRIVLGSPTLARGF